MLRRRIEDLRNVGMGEKSVGRGHDYVSVLTDIDGSRVLDVVPGHDGPAADSLGNTLSNDQKGTKQLWLYNPENMSNEQWAQIKLLQELDLKTSTAWAIRENFRWFWEYTYAGNARKFFSLWYDWACESELQPIIKVANMIKKRLTNILTNILTWFRHRISNGPAEGFNSRIQSLKSAARGFRIFKNYRTHLMKYTGPSG